MTIFNALPYTLTNGTTADADQVMADLNKIISDGNANAAANGANNDITSLSALSTPLSPGQGGSGSNSPGAGAIGHCRLTKSGTNLLLSPLYGNTLLINSQAKTIPDAGVTLAPGVVSPSTLYYIYAFMSGATMTLEASITAYAVQAGTGVPIKTGDATRTLVGMAYPIAGPNWADTDAQRFVASYFNRRPVLNFAALGADFSTASTSFVVALSIECVAWADSVLSAASFGECSNTVAGNLCGTVVADFAGTTALTGGTVTSTTPVANYKTGCGGGATHNISKAVSEGYNKFSMFVAVSAGTGTWYKVNSPTLGTGIEIALNI